MVAAEAGSLWCLWKLQAICMGVHRLTPVATSQLASGALGRVVPGGAATAAAAQYAMLAKAGVSRQVVAVGLTAGSVLQLGALAALPLAALPAIVFGLRIPEGLLPGLIGGAALFVAMFGFALLVIRRDAVLVAVARAARWVLRHFKRDDAEELPTRVLELRDELVTRLGRRWLIALAAAVGRWALDFAALAAALAAVSDDTRLSLVLLAYVGRAAAGAGPDHARRARRRRGGPQRPADRRRRERVGGRGRHARLPAGVVLADAARRARRLGRRTLQHVAAHSGPRDRSACSRRSRRSSSSA